MRKSFFLTVIIALVAVLGANKAQAQCTENELSPAAGVPHAYQVSTNTAPYTGGGTYTWYVTKNAANLLTGEMTDGSDFNATAASADLSAYNSTGADTKNKLELTWKTEAIVAGTPYFLVLKYSENNGTCDAMNMKVMKIQPLNQFMLDIDPVKDAAGTAFADPTSAAVCAADVDGASYDASADKVTYTYGENELYYKVNAKGFVGEWKPQIKLPALAATGGQKYVSAQWSSDNGSTWKNFTGLVQDASSQNLTSTDLASITDATNGTPIIVKIVVDNERYETLTDQSLEVATDGTYGGAGNDALNDKTDDCSADEAVFADKDATTIKARPTISATSGQFVQEVH